jgi:hypothetical protein
MPTTVIRRAGPKPIAAHGAGPIDPRVVLLGIVTVLALLAFISTTSPSMLPEAAMNLVAP